MSYYPADPVFESGYCGAEGICGGQVLQPIHLIEETDIEVSWPTGSSVEDTSKCSASVDVDVDVDVDVPEPNISPGSSLARGPEAMRWAAVGGLAASYLLSSP